MDVYSKSRRSAVMRAIKSKNTSPELAVRKRIHSEGFRYRLHYKKLPGKPDIVLPRFRVAVNVNGCFWHGHSCKRGKRVPKANRSYWTRKIDRNSKRDQRNVLKLRRLGWSVFTIWECKLDRHTQNVITRLRRLRDSGSE